MTRYYKQDSKSINKISKISYPICPIGLYFEGDGSCNPKNCNYNPNFRSCSKSCILTQEQLKVKQRKGQVRDALNKCNQFELIDQIGKILGV